MLMRGFVHRLEERCRGEGRTSQPRGPQEYANPDTKTQTVTTTPVATDEGRATEDVKNVLRTPVITAWATII